MGRYLNAWMASDLQMPFRSSGRRLEASEKALLSHEDNDLRVFSDLSRTCE